MMRSMRPQSQKASSWYPEVRGKMFRTKKDACVCHSCCLIDWRRGAEDRKPESILQCTPRCESDKFDW